MDDMKAIESLIDSKVSLLRAELEGERQKRLLRVAQIGAVASAFLLWAVMIVAIVAVR